MIPLAFTVVGKHGKIYLIEVQVLQAAISVRQFRGEGSSTFYRLFRMEFFPFMQEIFGAGTKLELSHVYRNGPWIKPRINCGIAIGTP